ncbi:High-affinity branched-chain amino acid transport system permease protein LivH [Sporomusa silvacetica DSM 10669]|uniref:High-affinity branched-chain amino acid transport system permease protein LivH n=1 Tax=Sporomusa silvacetica DSM 10669 TaxID=1123289 RepID=A0ABZ3IPS6_9FIRM|nr:branched-chain amino acid ABC transporter permease [Sporomusa silvacetica]OZC13830.1 high-affinity branched-chain amino acid transport system permease protein LivH [Sporomusa silvacetica DSM 10669]
MTGELIIQQLLNALSLGVMYSLMAVGFTLFFGVIEVINFAHGEVFMLGAFGALAASGIFISAGVAPGSIGLFVLVLLAVLVVGGLIGAVMERTIIKPMRSAPEIMTLLITLGASIVMREAVMLFFPNGRNPQPFPQLIALKSFSIGGVLIKPDIVLTVVLATLLITGLHLLIQKTAFGRYIRATAQDREAAKMMGIRVDRVFLITFVLGSALGAVAGLMNGMSYGIVKFTMGFIVGIKGFAAAVVGGLGNVYGAVAGGLLLGFLETMAVAFIPDGSRFQESISFIIVILFLVFRPGGIFGERTYEKV